MEAKKKILVTGGTGFIGSHTAVELIKKGYEVFIIDNLSNSHIEVLGSIEKITGTKPFFAHIDMNNRQALKEFLRIHHVDAVIHFAALKSVGDSVVHPLEYYRNNLISLINLIDLCRDHKIKNLVFSSSCSVYGEPDSLPINESAIIKPAQSPYANTKKIGEDILRDCSKVLDMKIIALRYFNPVGAHPSNLIGEYPLSAPLNLFPVITQTAIGKRSKMMVYGTDYTTPDGSCIRDYIHVMDVATAHVAAIARIMEGKCKAKFEVFNIGTGSGLSVLEVLTAFEKITGVKVNYELTARRAGDVEKVFADTSYANTELEWKTVLGLEEMITSAWAWEQSLPQKTATKGLASH